MTQCIYAIGAGICTDQNCKYLPFHSDHGESGFLKKAAKLTEDETTCGPELSVAIKADEDKNRVDLLPVGPMLAIAEVLTFGAKKYADHNWRKGFKWSRLIGAAMRHLFSFARGEDKDPETGLSHLAHLGCCVMFLLEHEQNKLGTDDRYKS